MKFIAVILSPLLLAAAAGARAADDSLWLTGAEWSHLGSYSYIGALTPLGNSSFGNGWVMRNWLDRVTYAYDGRVPDIHAQSYGFSPALGFQSALGSTRGGLYGAVRIAHTTLSPDDPSNADRGTRVRFALQADAQSPLGSFAENQLIAQGEFGNGGYYVRDRLLFHATGPYRLGPEAIVKGNDEYGAWQAGLALGGIALGRHTNLLLRGGVSDQRGQRSEGYASLELTLTP